MMEAVGISHNKFLTNNLDELDGSVAVTAHTKVFYYPDSCPRDCADETKSNCKFLTMVMEGWILCDIM